MIKRHRHIGRKIVLAVLAALLVSVGILAAVKRDTIRLFLNPNEIGFKSASEAAREVALGDYVELRVSGEPEGDFSMDYYIPDYSVRIHSEFKDGEAAELSGEVYVSSLTINSLSEALVLAEELTAPYMGKPELEALEMSLLDVIVRNAQSPYIDFSASVGRFTVAARGDTGGGSVQFWINVG